MNNHPPCLSCEDPTLIFVFGSNAWGNHAGGAARHAVEKHGAIEGVPRGLQGDSYAIDTMSGFDELKRGVEEFLGYASNGAGMELRFFVTAIGCGIAGYDPTHIAPLFADAPLNCTLPEGWRSL